MGTRSNLLHAFALIQLLLNVSASDVALSHLNLISQSGGYQVCAFLPDMYSAAYDNGAVELYKDANQEVLLAIGTYGQDPEATTISSSFSGGCCGGTSWYESPCECQSVTLPNTANSGYTVKMVCKTSISGANYVISGVYNVTPASTEL
jgi:hypothetical protein